MPRYRPFTAADASRQSAASAQHAADLRAVIVPTITALAALGMSQSQIADELNQLGFRTRHRKFWNPKRVSEALNGATDRPKFKRGLRQLRVAKT